MRNIPIWKANPSFAGRVLDLILQTLITFSVSHLPVVFLTRARLGRASPIPSRFSPCLNRQPEGPCTVGDRSRRFRLPPPDICRCSSSGQPVSCHKTSRGFHRSGASCQATGGRYHILTRRNAASMQVLLVISSSPGTSLTDSPLGDLKGWTWERKRKWWHARRSWDVSDSKRCMKQCGRGCILKLKG